MILTIHTHHAWKTWPKHVSHRTIWIMTSDCQIRELHICMYACIEQASVWVKGLNDFYLLCLPNKSSFMVEVIQCIAEIKLWLHSQMEYFLFKVLSIYARCYWMVNVWNCIKKMLLLEFAYDFTHLTLLQTRLLFVQMVLSFSRWLDFYFVSSHPMRWIQIVCHTTSMCRLLTMSSTVKHFRVSSSKYFNVTLSPCLYVLCSLFVHFSLLDPFFLAK